MAAMHLASTSHIATKPVALSTPKTQKRSTVTTRALFTKKRPAVVVEEPEPVKKSGFTLFGGSKKPAVVVEEPKPVKKSGFSLFGGNTKTETKAVTKSTKTATKATSGKKVDKAAEYKKKESILSAFDFSTARSKSDAELLYDARYGELKGGKMSPEQYAALRRKIGGTAK